MLGRREEAYYNVDPWRGSWAGEPRQLLGTTKHQREERGVGHALERDIEVGARAVVERGDLALEEVAHVGDGWFHAPIVARHAIRTRPPFVRIRIRSRCDSASQETRPTGWQTPSGRLG